jgi:hypothetical protein
MREIERSFDGRDGTTAAGDGDTRCRIEVLGEVRVAREDQIITRFRTQKAAHLLAGLALHPDGGMPREHLIDQF